MVDDFNLTIFRAEKKDMELGICKPLNNALDIGRSKRPLSCKLRKRMNDLLEALDGALHQE
jgi:hypothetical protein